MPPKLPTSTIYKITAPLIWLGLVWVITISSIIGFVYTTPFKATAESTNLFGAKTLTLPQTQFETTQIDSRVLKIEKVFAKFKCPLSGTGAFIVQKADEHDIPYWLIPAVSFQESSCGKNTAEPAGVAESYNAWGYGIWGKNSKTFANWEAGISAVSRYFGVNFFAKGITDPCEIMKVYTPPSKGSWCEGVKYFADLIENFESE